MTATVRICSPKTLPQDQAVAAAQCAVSVNPVNAPLTAPASQLGISPLAIAVMTSKYWGPKGRRLLTTFTEPISTDLRLRIFEHLNAWYTKGANVSFAYTTNPAANVRITREGDGYWSYLGTDVGMIPTDEPTMSLQDFTMRTSDREFYRVIRHEAGHTLGFPHEHMRSTMVSRIDPAKAYPFFWTNYGWDKTTVDEQVLTPLSEYSFMGTPPQATSIMCYQLPGSITKTGRPIAGGNDVTATDAEFAARIYPRGRR